MRQPVNFQADSSKEKLAPSDDEVLTMRLVDRALKTFIPKRLSRGYSSNDFTYLK